MLSGGCGRFGTETEPSQGTLNGHDPFTARIAGRTFTPSTFSWSCDGSVRGTAALKSIPPPVESVTTPPSGLMTSTYGMDVQYASVLSPPNSAVTFSKGTGAKMS